MSPSTANENVIMFLVIMVIAIILGLMTGPAFSLFMKAKAPEPASPQPRTVQAPDGTYWLEDPKQGKRWRLYINGNARYIIPNTEEPISVETKAEGARVSP